MLIASLFAQAALSAPITVDRDGNMADGPSRNASITPDGRYVVYESLATNLTPIRTDGLSNIFLYDQLLDFNAIVSLTGVQGAATFADGPCHNPDIDHEARFIVFDSVASNLVMDDNNGLSDVFLLDRFTGAVTRISTGSTGKELAHASANPSISGNGQCIIFQTKAAIDTDADRNNDFDIYLYDRLAGTTRLISKAIAGSAGNGPSINATISDDGSAVAFESKASDLVLQDKNQASDVFVLSNASPRIALVSASVNRMGVNDVDAIALSASANAASMSPAISSDGRVIAFASDATDLAGADTNGARDIYLVDTFARSCELVSINYLGAQANGDCNRPALSPSGDFVGYESLATNLTPFDTNGITDAFLLNRSTGQVGRISAPASDEMESATGFGMVAIGGHVSNAGDPRGVADVPVIVNELPGDTGETGPGDGMIVPGACTLPPRCLLAPASDFFVDPGQQVSFTVDATTLCRGRILRIDRLTGLPLGAIQDPEVPFAGEISEEPSTTLTWTPTEADIGVHTFEYQVTDNVGRISRCTATVTVGRCDDTPSCDIQLISNQVVNAGQPVTMLVNAQGFCEGQPVTLNVLEAPMNAMAEPPLPLVGVDDGPIQTQVDWLPMLGDIGMHIFRFETIDAFGQTSMCAVTITVEDPMCGFDPTCEITGPELIQAVPGDAISFSITGTTLCLDEVLTLDVTSLPSGAVLTPMLPATGAVGADVQSSFSWTPTADDAGMHEVRFIVTDGLDRTSTCTVTIDVGPCANDPVCESPDGDHFIVFMNEMLSFTVRGTSDCPDAVLTLDSGSLPDGAVVLEGLPLVGDPGQPVVGTFRWAPGIDGVFNVDFSVTDQTGQSSVCSFEISVVDCDLFPELTVDPDEMFLVAPGDLVTFRADGTTQCPKTGLSMTFNNLPPGAIITPDPTLDAGAEEDVGGIFEWIPSASDIGIDFTVDITLTDTFGRSVDDQIEISVTMICAEVEVNDTPEQANVIDADCVYFSGKLQKNPIIVCEADTYLTLFDKDNRIINRDDNGSDFGNGWASGLTDLGIHAGSSPGPFGDGGAGLINNGDGTFSLRMGITGRPDGLDGLFNGLFLNTAHGQLGRFSVTVTFKNINGQTIVPIGFPASAPTENPVTYEGEFTTGAEAFRINYTAPLGTALVDIQIDNLIEDETICDDVDFFVIRGLIPLCDYCITQVGGIDCECRPTDLNLGWFDKLGHIIDTDDNSGPVVGYADLCIVADINGRALIAVSGAGDNDFNGLADAWEDASSRAPAECAEPPHAHGVCGCYTLCIMASGPHAATQQNATTVDSEQQHVGDLNGDNRVDVADLAQLLGNMQSN